MQTDEALIILKVERTISKDDLKKQYLALVKTNHPDVNKDPGATDLIKQIIQAYEILKPVVPMKSISVPAGSKFTNGFTFFQPDNDDDSGFYNPYSKHDMPKFFEDMIRQMSEQAQRNFRHATQSYQFNTPPPPQQQTQNKFKRSQAGNLYKNIIINNQEFRWIIFSPKSGKDINKFKAMRVHGSAKLYYNEVFDTEFEAETFCEQQIKLFQGV